MIYREQGQHSDAARELIGDGPQLQLGNRGGAGSPIRKRA